LFFLVIVCQKHAQARAPGGGGAPRDSRTPDIASGTRLASIGIGILGDDARLEATGSRPVVRSNAVLARGSRTRERYQIPGNHRPGNECQESPGQIPG